MTTEEPWFDIIYHIEYFFAPPADEDYVTVVFGHAVPVTSQVNRVDSHVRVDLQVFLEKAVEVFSPISFVIVPVTPVTDLTVREYNDSVYNCF